MLGHGLYYKPGKTGLQCLMVSAGALLSEDADDDNDNNDDDKDEKG